MTIIGYLIGAVLLVVVLPLLPILLLLFLFDRLVQVTDRGDEDSFSSVE